MLFPLCFLLSESRTPRCPGPATRQCHDTFARSIKTMGLEPSQATSFLLNVPPTLLKNLQKQRPNFVSLHHSSLDKSMGFIMLGLLLLSVRTLLLSAVDRPSRKCCCQSDKPVVSIFPNPCLSIGVLQLMKMGSLGPEGNYSPLTQDGMCDPAPQHRCWRMSSL